MTWFIFTAGTTWNDLFLPGRCTNIIQHFFFKYLLWGMLHWWICSIHECLRSSSKTSLCTASSCKNKGTISIKTKTTKFSWWLLAKPLLYYIQKDRSIKFWSLCPNHHHNHSHLEWWWKPPWPAAAIVCTAPYHPAVGNTCPQRAGFPSSPLVAGSQRPGSISGPPQRLMWEYHHI